MPRTYRHVIQSYPLVFYGVWETAAVAKVLNAALPYPITVNARRAHFRAGPGLFIRATSA